MKVTLVNKINRHLLCTGTHVIEGSGKMLVLAVGLNSQTGSIYKMLGVVKEMKKSKGKREQQVKVVVVDAKNRSIRHVPEDDMGEFEDTPLQAKKSEDVERKQNIMAYKIGLLGDKIFIQLSK